MPAPSALPPGGPVAARRTRARVPAVPRARRPRRARPPSGARLPRRPDRAGHRASQVRVGVAPLPAVLRAAGRRRRLPAGRRASCRGLRSRDGAAARAPGGGGEPAGRGPGVRRGRSGGCPGHRAVRVVGTGRVVRGGRGGLRPPAQPLRAGRRAALHPLHPRRARRGRAGRVVVPGAGLRTGLPPRSYLPRTAVDFTHLVPSPTRTECPYKGRTSAYWSAATGSAVHPDIAWSYDFPTREMLPIAGLVAFYDEKVDVGVDGRRRP